MDIEFVHEGLAVFLHRFGVDIQLGCRERQPTARLDQDPDAPNFSYRPNSEKRTNKELFTLHQRMWRFHQYRVSFASEQTVH